MVKVKISWPTSEGSKISILGVCNELPRPAKDLTVTLENLNKVEIYMGLVKAVKWKENVLFIKTNFGIFELVVLDDSNKNVVSLSAFKKLKKYLKI